MKSAFAALVTLGLTVLVCCVGLWAAAAATHSGPQMDSRSVLMAAHPTPDPHP